jgi:Pvc16 N-terminal domain
LLRRCGDGTASSIDAMAGYRALAAVGRSVVALLERGFEEQLPTGRRPSAVLAGTRDFDLVNSSPSAVIRYPAVSLYCYRLAVDRETRPGWSSVASRDGVPRLPLRMHLLLTAWDEFAESELEWIGLAARILESNSVLTGPLLDPSGDWRSGDGIQLVSDEIALDSMSEAFQALTADYRLCLPYVARVIVLEGSAQDIAERVTTVAGRLDKDLLAKGSR